MSNEQNASLVLNDGHVFKGECIYNAPGVVSGEVVFTTSITGYVEVLTDPSYYEQIVVFSNPEIGNYGVCKDDYQSDGIKANAVIVRNLCNNPSSYRSQLSFIEWVTSYRVPIFYNVDTRALITHLRDKGSMMGVVAAGQKISIHDLYATAKNLAPMNNKRLSHFVSTKSIKKAQEEFKKGYEYNNQKQDDNKIVVIDFGIKREIVRYLCAHHKEVICLSCTTTPEDVLKHNPDGVFLSNGPGDPSAETHAVATIKALLSKVPIFGVCLGHQLLSMALGYKTYKMKFGHRGSNQPVKTTTGKILTTAQNHGFAVNIDKNTENISYEINISDKSIESIYATDKFAFSVQFHPEGAPGPHDAIFYFNEFQRLIKRFKKHKNPLNTVRKPEQDQKTENLQYR